MFYGKGRAHIFYRISVREEIMSGTIYGDIATRTQGEIYIGVVGPVRTGKSTFIKKFMETLVLPNMPEEYERERTKDELPQSSQGKTVMTTEPKFIPDTAARISLADAADLKVKMIDCVGFIVPEAIGNEEDGKPRMVHTPWSPDPMPFDDAAELGTKKVISDHCTIAVLVTSDGTFGEIGRQNYLEAEEKTVSELKKYGKPFVLVMNSKDPGNDNSVRLTMELEEKYSAPVALVNCLALDGEDIKRILELVLLEFPMTEIEVKAPPYVSSLPPDHPIRRSLTDSVTAAASKAEKIKEVKGALDILNENADIEAIECNRIDLGTGKVEVTLTLDPTLYFKVLSEAAGEEIRNEGELISVMAAFGKQRRVFKKYEEAIDEVDRKGYGIVAPELEDLKLQEPEIVKQPGGYGVKLRASAPSIHMIRVNTETEINPVVGTEQQSEELIRFLMKQFDEDPGMIWQTNMFGKSLHELVKEGLAAKVEHLPEQSRMRMCETLEKIINEGAGGLICIIL